MKYRRYAALWVVLVASIPAMIIGIVWGIVYLGFNLGSEVIKNLYDG